MDIFTTALTKVRTVPIKTEKLKVKALHKDSATGKLTDDTNHLEQHELYFIDEKEHHHHKEEKENLAKVNKTEDLLSTEDEQQDKTEQGIVASESVIIHKQEILHPKPAEKDPPEDVKHLDLYI